jgi:DNA-binding transcriptional ArsR family regulator
MNIDDSVGLLTAMANAKRLAILNHLIEREINVTELAELVGLSQSALSQHLSKLRAEQLVTTRRNSQTIYYSCKSDAVKAVLQTLDALNNLNRNLAQADSKEEQIRGAA